MLYKNFCYMVFSPHSAGKVWSSMCVGNVPDFDFQSVKFSVIAARAIQTVSMTSRIGFLCLESPCISLYCLNVLFKLLQLG